MKAFWRRLRARIRHRHFAADLDEELAFHREMKKGALTRAGVDNADDLATRTAHEMGNTTLAREAARAVWIAPWIDSVRQDLVYAARSLRRQPAFTLAALAALILAIGLNTSLFTAYYALALRPWAVADPWRIVMLFDLRPNGRLNGGFSLTEYRYLRDHSRTLSGLIAKHADEVVIGDDEAAQRGIAGFVNANYFEVLGVRTAVGRAFLAEEDRLGAPQAVCVIGYGLWQSRFGGDPGAVGRTLRLNDAMFTIVGVIASDFNGTGNDRESLWVPLAAMPLAIASDSTFARDMLEKPSACCVPLVGRLAPGVTREQARFELDQLSGLFRGSVGQEVTHVVVRPTRLLAQNKGNGPMVVFALMFSCTTLVLLLACANVGNLCIARAFARQREIAVRLSLGASRARVIRQLLTESLLLAVIAATIGIGIAFVLPDLLAQAAFPGSSVPALSPDWTLVAFTCGLCALACLLFGLAPAIRGTRLGAMPLADYATGTTRAIGTGFSLRGLLLATQIAISLILLVGATLLARGVQKAGTQNPGFAIDDVALASLELPARFDRPRVVAFVRELTTALRASADLRSAALTMFEPLANGRTLAGIRLPGEAENRTRTIQAHRVSPEYFDVLEIPLVAGRGFTPGDAGRDVALVNQTMARELWPNESPVGRTIIGTGPRNAGVAPSGTEIIGVVRDAYTSGLDHVEPMFYQPLPPDMPFPPRILLKQRSSAAGAAGTVGAAGLAGVVGPAGTAGADRATGPAVPARTVGPAGTRDSAAAATALRALVHSLNPRVGVKVEPLRANFDRWLAASRIGAAIAGAVALLALVLAAIGVFGVFAFIVQARTQEIGLRMAIGAQPHQVVALVLRSTAWATLGGLGVGAIGAFAGSRLLAGQLYGVSPSDPTAYTIASALLALAAAAATYLPARRATRIDPIAALRRE